MLASLLPVRGLMAAIFMLMAGSGFMSTLISLRLERGGSGTLLIGLVGTAYFAGLAVGALRAGTIVQRVGHIRAFAAFVSVLSASTLAYTLWQTAPLWMLLRAIDGLCVAGIFVCLESWLNERAEPATRGGILAGYMIALYSGQALGQMLLTTGTAVPSAPFVIASLLISLAAIPVVLTHIAAPSLDGAAQLSVRQLYTSSPLGAIGAATTGLMLGAFYALAAVHVRRLGLDIAATASFMTTVILGGVALQWPLGRLSDRFDRRRVIIWCFAAATLVSLALAMTTAAGLSLWVLGALFGGLSFALYPLSVAHSHDRLAAAERVAASGGLVLLYSAGAALGPIGAAIAMTAAGPGGLFLFIALCAGGTLAFGLWRQAASAPVPGEEQRAYQILPRTTPVAAMLDPDPGEDSAGADALLSKG